MGSHNIHSQYFISRGIFVCTLEDEGRKIAIMFAICTSEEKRVFRLLSMLNGEGRLALRFCIIYLFPHLATVTFGDFLGQASVRKRIEDALYNSRSITADQFDILYPKSGVQDLESLDITLLVFIIRQLHPFLKPSNQIWTDPPDGNTSLEADISRIRAFRNSLSHPDIESFTVEKFEKEYKQIECILCRIVNEVGGNQITPREIKDKLKIKKDGPFEAKPMQKDISTTVTDSLELMNKPVQRFAVDDKTRNTACSDKARPSNTHSSDSGSRRSAFSRLCPFHSCFNDPEPRTILTNDHSSQQYRCSITSIDVLPNKTIVATDSAHNVVEAFTNSGQPFDEFECLSPNSVCALSHETAAVSLRQERKLVILNISSQCRSIMLKVEYAVKCSTDIVGIKYSSDFLYVLCEQGEVHTINKNTGAEQALYQTNIQTPSYFDIAADASQIYLSKGTTIIRLGLPGNCDRQYTDRWGRELKGIVVRKNKVYISVWDGDFVLKLNADLTLVKEIAIENLQNPMALCKFKGHLYLSKYRTDLSRCMCREIVSVKL